jgi:hypothetical protein
MRRRGRRRREEMQGGMQGRQGRTDGGFNEGEGQGSSWSGPWLAEAGEHAQDGDAHTGQRASLWEAELTALWEAEAAGRFAGFGRATHEEEAWRTDLNR